jgi:hypothetical protein
LSTRTEDPELSVVVVIVSDTIGRPDCSHLTGCLEALRQQDNPPRLEIVVPYAPDTRGVDELRARYPEVRLLAITDLRARRHARGSREHHDELRARGIAAAQGGMVALLEDHGKPTEAWAAEMAASLRQGYAGAGGPIENGVARALNEAVYLCDFFRYQNPVTDGPTAVVSDANVVYWKRCLSAVADVWQDSFREPLVNGALIGRGEKLGLTSRAVAYQHRENLTLGAATRERFIWGRSYAATRRSGVGLGRALGFALLSPALLVLLPTRIIISVLRKGRADELFVKALAAVIWLSAVWSAGELVGYLAGDPVKKG